MSKVSLKVVVAGRTYPLTVQESEVEKVQRAADDINKAIKQLQDNFAVRDMQDLLAMTALQLSTKGGAKATTSVPSQVDFSETVAALSDLATELDALK
ncbi:MAG: cell division protein ZapA [Fluviicola sp.]|nr:cell division protein ZapA [Fluviicola sp.]MBP6272050.1 cell division protein ZapA [Fluviicola sp.]